MYGGPQRLSRCFRFCFKWRLVPLSPPPSLSFLFPPSSLTFPVFLLPSFSPSLPCLLLFLLQYLYRPPSSTVFILPCLFSPLSSLFPSSLPSAVSILPSLISQPSPSLRLLHLSLLSSLPPSFPSLPSSPGEVVVGNISHASTIHGRWRMKMERKIYGQYFPSRPFSNTVFSFFTSPFLPHHIPFYN